MKHSPKVVLIRETPLKGSKGQSSLKTFFNLTVSLTESTFCWGNFLRKFVKYSELRKEDIRKQSICIFKSLVKLHCVNACLY